MLIEVNTSSMKTENGAWRSPVLEKKRASGQQVRQLLSVLRVAMIGLTAWSIIHSALNIQSGGANTTTCFVDVAPPTTTDGVDPLLKPAVVPETLMIIASVPYDERHVAAVWSQLECFTEGIDKLVLSVPHETKQISEQLVQAAKERLGLDVDVHYFTNNRYDTGLWCDALLEEGYNNKNNNTNGVPFENTILLNDSVFALRQFNGILQALQADKERQLQFVSLSHSHKYHYWLESVFRGFSRQGIATFVNYSCQLEANHSSFQKKTAIVLYHEMGLVTQYPPNTTVGLYESDPPTSWPMQTTWVINKRLWKWLKDEHNFPVAKMNQAYAIPSLSDPIASTCTSKMDPSFLKSLNFSSFSEFKSALPS
jgi:hypothetical protein